MIINKLVVPEIILEEIRQDGKLTAVRDREAIGFLFGWYDLWDLSIVVSRLYKSWSIRGDNTFRSNVSDTLRIALNLLLATARYQSYEEKLRKYGRIPAEVEYHTHPRGSWSRFDLERIVKNEHYMPKYGIATAHLLYSADVDEFEAVNGYCQMIPVLKIYNMMPRPANVLVFEIPHNSERG